MPIPMGIMILFVWSIFLCRQSQEVFAPSQPALPRLLPSPLPAKCSFWSFATCKNRLLEAWHRVIPKGNQVHMTKYWTSYARTTGIVPPTGYVIWARIQNRWRQKMAVKDKGRPRSLRTGLWRFIQQKIMPVITRAVHVARKAM